VDIAELCRAVGVKQVYEVNAFDVVELEKTVKEATAMDEIVVIITKSPCVLLSKAPVTKQYRIEAEECKKCGMCMKPGCPAITKKENGTIAINDTMCNGCGLCETACKFGAIKPVQLR
jgi:indolepyruvate ferredoxin oxidoreductase alpha subunit